MRRATVSTLLACAFITAAACRPANPPNALTAMLRAVPRMGGQAIESFLFADFEQTRRDLAIPKTAGVDSYPAVLAEIVHRISTSPLAEGSLYGIGQLEALLEVTLPGVPPAIMLVGSFDSAAMERSLDSKGLPSTYSGLFRLYRTPGGEGVGIGPRRLVYSNAYPSAQAITGFRGGEDSLLGLEGLQNLTISAGRPAAMAVAPPDEGCGNPRWMAVGVRYIESSRPSVAVVVQYPDPETAAASRRLVSSGLGEIMGKTGSGIDLVDVRQDMVVSSISTSESGAAALLGAVHRGSSLERALRC